MKKEILKIVITGGPCGGKTTALEEATNLLRSLGYTVYIASETATQLINAGIKPFGDNKINLRDFQSLILDNQLYKEEIIERAANYCPNPKVAILYDRGIMDNRAYIDDKIFDEFLIERNMSESQILTRYDIVIHLVTAAVGKEEYYTILNNKARTETPEEARRQDILTMQTWRNHPNLKIVDNSTLFDGKILRVNNIIRAYIGEEEVIKQERYLIDSNNIDFNAFSHAMIKEEIEEFVLSYANIDSKLYSKSTINGASFYTYSKRINNMEAKTCRNITEEEYYNNKNNFKGDILNKTRYNFIDNGERFRLDIFTINNHSFVILERDVVDSNRKELPKFAKVFHDITNNRNYDDDSIITDYTINNIYKRNML